MADKPQVLVFGATGAIGKFITEEIIHAKDSFEKIGIFTSHGTVEAKRTEIEALKDQGVEIIAGDVDNESDVSKAYQKYDTVVCCFGRAVIAKQIDLIRLAEASNTIRRFFPSEYGTDIEYGPQSANEVPHQQKLKVRAYIRENVKRMAAIYVVTGPYSDMFLVKGSAPSKAGGFDVAAKKAVLLGTGDEKVSFTTMADTGKLVVAALQHPEASNNKILLVNSFTTTGHDIIKELEKQTGGKWQVEYIPLDQLKVNEKEAYDKSDPLAAIYSLRRIWVEGGTQYKKIDNESIRAPQMETLSDQVKKMVMQAS